MEELMLISNPYNPRRKSRKGGKMSKSNPMKGITQEWFQGINPIDAGAAVGGLAASTMLPGAIIRVEEGAPLSVGQKIGKLLLGAGSAVAMGFVFRNMSPSAGKAAVIGGIAGTAVQGIGMFTNIKIGQKSLSARKSPAAITSGRKNIGESRYMPTYPEEAGVQVSVT